MVSNFPFLQSYRKGHGRQKVGGSLERKKAPYEGELELLFSDRKIP
jgi:hypothetical protein